MDDLRPPTAPGRKVKKEGFFSKLFRRNIDEVRVTSTSSADDARLDDIRKRIGITPSQSQSSESVQKDSTLAATNKEEVMTNTQSQAPNLEDTISPLDITLEPATKGIDDPFTNEDFDSDKLTDLNSEDLAELQREHANVDSLLDDELLLPPKDLNLEEEYSWVEENKPTEDTTQEIPDLKAPTSWDNEAHTNTIDSSKNYMPSGFDQEITQTQKTTIASEWDTHDDMNSNKANEEQTYKRSEYDVPLDTQTETSVASNNNYSSFTQDSQKKSSWEHDATEHTLVKATTHALATLDSKKEMKESKTQRKEKKTQSQEKTSTATVKNNVQTSVKPDLFAINDDIAKVKQAIAPNEHHKQVDAAFSDITKKHEDLDRELERITSAIRVEIPEWKYQKKEVKPENYFILKNGQAIKSFKDLLEALSFIDDETFEHHVTENRNDFAAWVENILEEEKLAERIRNKKARKELLSILRKHEDGIFQNLGKETKKLQGKAASHNKQFEKVQDLQKKIETLQKELEKKSSALVELRGVHAQKIKKHIEKHIDDRIGEARSLLDKDQKDIAKKSNDLSKKESALWEREQALEQAEKLLNSGRKELEKDTAAFTKERNEAQEMLRSAEAIRIMREEAIKAQAATKKLLDQNKKAEQAAKLRERDADKQIQKLSRDTEKYLSDKKKTDALAQDLAAREKILSQKEKEMSSLLAKTQKTAQTTENERKEFLKVEQDGLHDLAEKRESVEKLLKELEVKTQEYREMVDDHEAQVKKNQEILDETQKLHDELLKRQDALNSKSMREYLRTKLDQTVVGSVTSDEAPPLDEITNLHLYKLIDECKEALGKNELKRARQVYNTLRDEFGQTKLSPHEKSVLYNSIRELYDDIHLAMLNQ